MTTLENRVSALEARKGRTIIIHISDEVTAEQAQRQWEIDHGDTIRETDELIAIRHQHETINARL